MKTRTLLLALATLAALALTGCGQNPDNNNSTNTDSKPATGGIPATNAMAPAPVVGITNDIPANTPAPPATNQ